MQSIFNNNRKSLIIDFQDRHTDIEDSATDSIKPSQQLKPIQLKKKQSIYLDDNDIQVSSANILESPSKRNKRFT